MNLRALRLVALAAVTALPASLMPAAASGCKTTCHSLKVGGALKVSKVGGLGQIETHGSLGAVLGRDEGIVTLLDLKKPDSPKKLGHYDDDAVDSLDGDLAFSDDGKWLFYARQTRQFSKDGLHVLDVTDPRAPRLAHYQVQGGAYRVAYYRSGDEHWVISLDATHGLVINRFEPTTGALVPVFVDALPATRVVGGPASAGIFVDRKDPATGKPLLYMSTGGRGLDVYDLSDPLQPVKAGSWNKVGLADIEVHATKSSRTIYAVNEYWFKKNLPSQVIVLNATKLGGIKETKRWTFGKPVEGERVQGIELVWNMLVVANSTRGVLAVDRKTGKVLAKVSPAGKRNEGAGVLGSRYAMDVEARAGSLLSTDAVTGTVTSLHLYSVHSSGGYLPAD